MSSNVAPDQDMTKRLRALRVRDGDLCYLCQYPAWFDSTDRVLRATVDHVVPKSLGGSSDFDNLKIAHRHCNNRRGNQAITPELLQALRLYVHIHLSLVQEAA